MGTAVEWPVHSAALLLSPPHRGRGRASAAGAQGRGTKWVLRARPMKSVNTTSGVSRPYDGHRPMMKLRGWVWAMGGAGGEGGRGAMCGAGGERGGRAMGWGGRCFWGGGVLPRGLCALLCVRMRWGRGATRWPTRRLDGCPSPPHRTTPHRTAPNHTPATHRTAHTRRTAPHTRAALLRPPHTPPYTHTHTTLTTASPPRPRRWPGGWRRAPRRPTPGPPAQCSAGTPPGTGTRRPPPRPPARPPP